MKHVVWYVYILEKVNYKNGEASKVLLMQAVGPGWPIKVLNDNEDRIVAKYGR